MLRKEIAYLPSTGLTLPGQDAAHVWHVGLDVTVGVMNGRKAASLNISKQPCLSAMHTCNDCMITACKSKHIRFVQNEKLLNITNFFYLLAIGNSLTNNWQFVLPDERAYP